ncbi:MAG TPA: diguanylate cyclase [Candidatus Brocadiaceae bacterium]|nr:diguanylate cyclase [Candidatus Brocadiaceae bacterium]
MKKITWSLSEKAFLSVIVILLPVLVTFILVYHQNKALWEERIFQETTFIAETYERQVYQFLEMTKQRVRDFAGDCLIKRQLLKKIKSGKFASDITSSYLVKHKLGLDKSINTIHILSLDGWVIASTSKSEIGRDFSKEAVFIQGKNAVAVVEKNFGHCNLTELAISAPILDTKTSSPVGVIVNFVPITEIEKVLSGEYAKEVGAISWAKGRWKTLEVYLVNRDRLMLTSSLFVRDAVLRQVVNTLPVNACLMGNNTEITKMYKNYRGVAVVGASMCFPLLKWVLLAEIDKDEALAAVKATLRNAIITAAVIVVMFSLLLAAFLARVVKPIRRVSDAARKVAGGNFNIIVPVQTHDEIATLCESFNYMTYQIKDKTAALVKTEEELRLLQTMILTIIESKDTHAAFGIVLRKVCETTGWICGEAWVPSPNGTQLEYCPSWYSKVEGLEKFRKASEGCTFLPGNGLPGRVWLSKKPVWIRDVTVDANFPRVNLAREHGLKAAMAIPVLANDKVIAVMVFFVFESRAEDERLIGLVSAIAAQLGLVIQRIQMEETIRQMAYHDTLTGLPNRVLFQDRLTLALIHSQRKKQKCAVLFLDLDRFKAINDTLGHNIGDKFLQGVADRLRRCVRGSDTVSRLGGDEFNVLLQELDHAEDAIAIAEKIVVSVSHPLKINNNAIQITVSIGIAMYPDDGNNAETLMKNADLAMYQAKKRGRNNYQFFHQLPKE